MSSIAIALGLRPDPSNPTMPVPNNAAYFIIFHFLFAYVFLSTRPTKIRLKLDHNGSPREDLTKYGDTAVKSGKISQAQLDFLKRNEACHANSMEHFPVFVGAVLLAAQAGLPNQTVNLGCVWYTAARLVYAAAYLSITRGKATYVRSIAWWVGNGTCIWLLWQSGKSMNRG